VKRESGILLHISSLPSRYHIGSLGKEAYNFVDFLKKAKQSYWQLLPFGHTGYGDSPYQTFSVFAGNPYFIDLDLLVEDNLLTKDEVMSHRDNKEEFVDYGHLFNTRIPLLKKAYKRGFDPNNEDYRIFLEQNVFWVHDYAFYFALKEHYNYAPVQEWPIGIRARQSDYMHSLGILLEETINFYRYIQFLFYTQFRALKKYANDNGIKIFGDTPIYASPDSADVWAMPQNFRLNHEFKPTVVAGVPPDYFSETGQLWGNPLYNWDFQKQDNYYWWRMRIEHMSRMLDALRIDHFRALHTYFSVPYGEETAKNGNWEIGPGMQFINLMKENFPNLQIIAEDLGDLDDSVLDFIKETCLPGMRVLQFAFDHPDSPYLPHNHEINSVLYTGTHDNDTLASWLKSDTDSVEKAGEYFDFEDCRDKVFRVIRYGMSSVCRIFIAPIQDYLGLSGKYRMNTPGTPSGNWQYRVASGQLSDSLAEKIADLTTLYGRTPDFSNDSSDD